MTTEPLTRKQLLVIEDLARADRDLPQILRLRRVSRVRFTQWQVVPEFREALQQRIEFGYLRAMALVAREAQEAVQCLVALTHAEKDDCARKACLDVLALAQQAAGQQPVETKAAEPEAPWSESQVQRILAILAEDEPRSAESG